MSELSPASAVCHRPLKPPESPQQQPGSAGLCGRSIESSGDTRDRLPHSALVVMRCTNTGEYWHIDTRHTRCHRSSFCHQDVTTQPDNEKKRYFLRHLSLLVGQPAASSQQPAGTQADRGGQCGAAWDWARGKPLEGCQNRRLRYTPWRNYILLFVHIEGILTEPGNLLSLH